MVWASTDGDTIEKAMAKTANTTATALDKTTAILFFSNVITMCKIDHTKANELASERENCGHDGRLRRLKEKSVNL